MLKKVSFDHFVEVQGVVEANSNVMVSSATGGKITRILARKGQKVRKGQLLAQLDDAVMRSSIEEVKTQLELAKIMFTKQENLWNQQIGTEVQYLTSKNQKEALEKRLNTLEEQLDMNKIKAPIGGTVDEIMPKVGEILAPGMPAFRIVNSSDLSLVAQMSEKYIPYVRRGDLVKIHFPTLNKDIEAKISIVGQAIDALARTFKVEVKLPNDPMLKANMYGKISVNDQSRADAITIPQGLIQKSELGEYVFVAEKEGEKWLARRKNIKTDLSYDGEVEVVSGLEAGDRLIIAGYKGLSDGQVISFEEAIAVN